LEYRAPAEPGIVDLVVEDAAGQKVFVAIEVGDGNAPPAPVAIEEEGLQLNPLAPEVYVGGQVQFTATGGKPPYTARLSKKFGSISNRDLLYAAPMKPGDVLLTVTDALGDRQETSIRVVPVPKAQKEIILDNMEFVFNSNKLTGPSEKLLERNLRELSDVNIQRIVVIGHTDSIGSDEYNQKLSLRRAETVARELRRRLRVDANVVQAVGEGESRPIATNNTDQGRQRNRRVELRLYYKK
ncbi:MAG: OmpA family protein, partial [Bdellovibrio sp.]